MKYKQYSSFELTVAKIFLANKKSLTLVIYLLVVICFNYNISMWNCTAVCSNENIILAGDVNVHMDEDNLYSNQFKDILDTFNATQHVNFPTHIASNTLDIIITFDKNSCISNKMALIFFVKFFFLCAFFLRYETSQRG